MTLNEILIDTFLFNLSLVDSVQLSGFEVANHGATSVLLYGSNSQVYNLVIAGNGCGGLHVSGGDQVCNKAVEIDVLSVSYD